jgi:hypothetical protein
MGWMFGLMAVGCAPWEMNEATWKDYEDAAALADELQVPPPATVSIDVVTDVEAGSWAVAIIELPTALEGLPVFVPFTDMSDDVPFCPPPLAGDCLDLTGNLVHLARGTTVSDGSAYVAFWVPEDYVGSLGFQAVVPTAGGRQYSQAVVVSDRDPIFQVSVQTAFAYQEGLALALPWSVEGTAESIWFKFEFYRQITDPDDDEDPLLCSAWLSWEGVVPGVSGNLSATSLFEWSTAGLPWETDCAGVLNLDDELSIQAIVDADWTTSVERTVSAEMGQVLTELGELPVNFFGADLYIGEVAPAGLSGIYAGYELGLGNEVLIDPATRSPIFRSANVLTTVGGDLGTAYYTTGVTIDFDAFLDVYGLL